MSQVMFTHPGLSTASILLGQVIPEPHLPLMLLVIFYSPIPSMLLGYKSPLFLIVFGVDSNLSPSLQDPIAVVFAPIVTSPSLWMKSSLSCYNKCHWNLFPLKDYRCYLWRIAKWVQKYHRMYKGCTSSLQNEPQSGNPSSEHGQGTGQFQGSEWQVPTTWLSS